MEQKNQRKVVLVNPKFQLTFIGFMAALAALVMGTLYGANRYFFWKFNHLGETLQLPPDHVFFEFIRHQQNAMAWVFGTVAVVVTLLLVALGLVFSHRIAGPLHRLHTHLLKAGRERAYRPVAFRKGDFFAELAEAYNAQLPDASSSSRATSKDRAG